jgi:hypothetical protein
MHPNNWKYLIRVRDLKSGAMWGFDCNQGLVLHCQMKTVRKTVMDT